MPAPTPPPPSETPADARITLIDALRGSALVGLFMVHCVEHFELTFYPENRTPFMQQLDGWTNWAAFFLFSGKAYAIFAMMFGVSFMLLLQSWSRKGIDVATRFPWRLTLLAAFGYLNGILYSGDILLVLAVLGLPLVVLYRLPDKVLGWLAVLFLLQLPTAGLALHVLLNPEYTPATPVHWRIFGEVRQLQATGSFGDLATLLAGRGQLLRLLFTYETGRYLQMFGLFICGLLLGRHHILEQAASARRLATRALVLGLIGFAVFYPLKRMIPDWGLQGLRGYHLQNWLGAYVNLSQMAVWVGGFVLLYLHGGWRRALDWFVPLGRMSLTGYVTQALCLVPLFYGFGFGLYSKLGEFHSELIGIGFIVAQCWAAKVWLRHFHYGPLEWLWRSGTIGSWKTPFRRQPREASRNAAAATAG